MDIDEVENLKENDEEFRKSLNLSNIINNEELNENTSNVYNPPQFQLNCLLIIFRIKKSLKNWSIALKVVNNVLWLKINRKKTIM